MLMVSSLSFGVYAETTDESPIDAGVALTEDPLNQFIENLDPKLHSGIYADENGETHIASPDPEKIQNQVNRNRAIASVPIEKVEYSWQDLLDAQKALLAIQHELGITAVGLDASENALTIFAGELSEEQKQAVIDASPVKNVLFYGDAFLLSIGSGSGEEAASNESEDGSVMPAATPSSLMGGQWLQNSKGSNWSTVGYGAFQNYGTSSQRTGYVTCGHGYKAGQSVYQGSNLIGTARSVNVSSGIDIAFIESDIPYGGQKNGITADSYTSPTAGRSVYMCGAKSGNKNGKINSTDISGKWQSGSTITSHAGLFSFTFPSQAGDSGSALIEKTPEGKYYLIGLNVGMWYNNDKIGEDLIWGAGCKWPKAADAIKVTPRNP